MAVEEAGRQRLPGALLSSGRRTFPFVPRMRGPSNNNFAPSQQAAGFPLAKMRADELSAVVPAQAGTHTPQQGDVAGPRGRKPWWLWVPAFPGRVRTPGFLLLWTLRCCGK